MNKLKELFKNTERLDLIVSFISGILIGSLSLYFVVQGNNIAEKQSEISKINTTPYFQITDCVDSNVQVGYKINNIGGYIQNARITLKNIINISLQDYGGNDFYFPYQTITTKYADIKDGELAIYFNDYDFGINNWEYGRNQMVNKISVKLSDMDIHSLICYVEYLEIEYIDYNRDFNKECYLIGVNEDETSFLELVHTGIEDEIKNANNSYIFSSAEKDDSIFKKVGGSNMGGSGRGVDLDSIFINYVVDAIQNYVSEQDEIYDDKVIYYKN